MENMYEKIQGAVAAIKKKTEIVPEVGIILGTGLGNLTDMIDVDLIIPYNEIPNFPKSTVASHDGNLIIGTLSEKPVVVMQGRLHYYEGYSLQEVTFPVRVLKELGIKSIIITNACGGMNAQFRKGDIVFIQDQINMTGFNPLIGVCDDRLGTRFPDMSIPYDEKFIELAEAAALEEGYETKKGTYFWVTGPQDNVA